MESAGEFWWGDNERGLCLTGNIIRHFITRTTPTSSSLENVFLKRVVDAQRSVREANCLEHIKKANSDYGL